jgi:hypothetical protein
MKRNNWITLAVLVACLAIGSMMVYAESRHTQQSAPVRYSVTLAEGQALSKTISCYDPDGDDVTIEVVGAPTGMAVSPQAAAPAGYSDPDLPPVPSDAPSAKWFTRTITWTPTYQQAGSYTVYVHATDTNGDDDWVKYEITVTNTNRPPVL